MLALSILLPKLLQFQIVVQSLFRSALLLTVTSPKHDVIEPVSHPLDHREESAAPGGPDGLASFQPTPTAEVFNKEQKQHKPECAKTSLHMQSSHAPPRGGEQRDEFVTKACKHEHHLNMCSVCN